MNKRILLVEDVHKVIRGREIIKGINFSIDEGEVLGFLGPNGSGKSTTLRMIVGLSKPSSGKIEICGYSILHNYVKAMESVGCIVEGPDLYEYMSGEDNLEMLAAMDKNVTNEDIEYAVNLVNMEKSIKDKISTYSLGMKQRMGIAQALMKRPKLLILDEPTNGLDPAGINDLRNLIQRLSKEEKISVLISSHLIAEIELICDKVSIIKDGEILKNASVAELLKTKEVFWELNDNEKGREVLKNSWRIDSRINGSKLEASVDEEKLISINDSFLSNGIKIKFASSKQRNLEDLFLNITEDK
ncbi:ABC-2 type transport system ATP-binding protein [Clostridium acetobutylicum]|uniref:Protein from GDSL (Phospholipase B) family of lipolitic enzymes n=1 Tax=Clostridium acetobutylicum (strain ATCC 824 / DSM 792 / JCM 1419 / IAM 19013 / LMG 5710 / NBRC 13948 / NRRL B-527 / VKM B-1787 / 2291 / W) TaxID=272562 RepID=Q97ET0_CLOAB|nr:MULTISPECIES: ABC transporter ATP-binding protein [Clostridium]AAK80967.1 Protein from GDSL (phospholipase B) family of lipolitic enzymes [Clostridium acetobutylicum ATCC 824]ADZ22069.1 Protein from GDSL (phospholipase B) family of lipolitic enzyme [Clostridium acetobutylicum EA 2018]AEI34627.1 GDSL (phospholipase B) family lipolitic protein [Clostridium acetobutylicum DSM 1731]AWV78623.1 ABC transporter ATP-binding protein [Clostridium acetobutylicum]MBC2393483.1 ABC transporter ATP-bindin